MLPDITRVNFRDPDEAAGFASLIFATYNLAPTSALRRTAAAWLTGADAALPLLLPGAALTIITPYDLIYRIAYRTPAPQHLLTPYLLKALDAPDADPYALHRAISQQLPQTLPPTPLLQWHSQSIDRWHKQFRYGRSLTPLTPYDTLNRVSILLDADLRPYESANAPCFRQKLFDRHRPYLTTISSSLPLPLLTSLDRFLTSSLPYLTPDDAYAVRLSLHHTLLSHPHLHPYSRASLLLAPPVAPSARTAS